MEKSMTPETKARSDFDWSAIIPTIITTSIATFVVVLRLFTRWKLVRGVGFDDLVIVLSLLLSWTILTLTTLLLLQNFSTHTWAHPLDLTPDTAILFLSQNCVYILLLCVTKLSILLQYLRIFHTPLMRRLTWISIFALVPTLLWGVLGAVLICDPVEKIWKPGVGGSCASARVYWLSTAGVNIVLDFAVLVLPIPSIVGLRLPRRQKGWLVGVFLLGFFTCAVSMARVALVHDAYAKKDFTHSSAGSLTWSTVEANTGIVCASLLALKPLIVWLFSKVGEERKPPRWSMTLDAVDDVEKGGVEQREDVGMGRRCTDGSYGDGDELTLVGTRTSVMVKMEKKRSLSEQKIDDMEIAVPRQPEAVCLSPLRQHILEEEEWDGGIERHSNRSS